MAKYEEHFVLTNPSQGIGFAYTSYVAFSTDEVLLNRAEAYAMTGEYGLASADLTAFLSKRTRSFDPQVDEVTQELMEETFPVVDGEYDPFYPLDNAQVSFVKGIAEFRRREFCHEGLRWLDVKRFDLVVSHAIEGQDEPIVLPKGDMRRVLEIPEQALAAGIRSNR